MLGRQHFVWIGETLNVIHQQRFVSTRGWDHLLQIFDAESQSLWGAALPKLPRRLPWWRKRWRMVEWQCRGPMLSKFAMVSKRTCCTTCYFLTHCRSIWILPRSGGPFLKKSAAYPKRFGQSVCRHHQRFLDDPCLMLKGFSSWISVFLNSPKQMKRTSTILGIGNSYSFSSFHKNMQFSVQGYRRYGDLLDWNRNYNQNPEIILGANLEWCGYSFLRHSVDSAFLFAEELNSAQAETPVVDDAAWALSKVKSSGCQWIDA